MDSTRPAWSRGMIGIEHGHLQYPRLSLHARCGDAPRLLSPHPLRVYNAVRRTRKGRDMSKSVVRRVGIVGLGKMGQPMARHLRKAGFDVTACDIDERARREAERSGITIASDPRAVAERSDFVIVVVGCDRGAGALFLGGDGIAAAAREGLIVGIASTVAPRTMQ